MKDGINNRIYIKRWIIESHCDNKNGKGSGWGGHIIGRITNSRTLLFVISKGNNIG